MGNRRPMSTMPFYLCGDDEMGVDKNEARNQRFNTTPKGKKDKPQAIPFSEMQIARIELTEPEKEELRAFIANGELNRDFDDELTTLGYTVKFSSDKNSNGKLCSVSYSFTGHENSGYTLIGRGGTNAKALAAIEYKIVYICGDQPWVACQNSRGGNYDDLG